MRRPRKALVLLAILAIVTGLATGFGSTHGSTSKSVSPGETASFNIYVFGEGVVEIGIEEVPEGWSVEVEPDTVDLSRPGDYDTRYMSLGGETVRAVEIKVSVKPSPGASKGAYEITTFLESGGKGAEGTGFSVSQVQEFGFTVEVEEETGTGSQSNTDSAGTSATTTGADSLTALDFGDDDEGGEIDPGEEGEGPSTGAEDGNTGSEDGDTDEEASETAESTSGDEKDRSIGAALDGITGAVTASPTLTGFILFQFLWIGALLYIRRMG